MDTSEFYGILLDKLADNSLESIIKIAAIYLNQHITMLDIGYNVLCSWPQEEIGDYFWDNQQKHGFVPDEAMQQIFESNYPDATFSGISYIDWGNIKYPRCVSTIQYAGKALGHVSIYHTDFALSKEELISACTCLDHVLKIFFINNARIITKNETVMSALVSKLMSGEKLCQKYLDEWEKISGSPLSGRFIVLALGRPPQNHKSIYDYLTNRLKELHSSLVFAVINQCCYILLYNISTCKFAKTLVERIKSILSSYKLHCGMSEEFEKIDYLQDYMYQAQVALEMGSKRYPEYLMHSFSNLRPEVMLSYILQNMGPINYMHPILTALQEEDNENGTEYYKTLSVYFDCICNSALAATKLNIHRNTLLYRINHIEEKYGISFTDSLKVKKVMLSSWVAMFDEKSEL